MVAPKTGCVGTKGAWIATLATALGLLACVTASTPDAPVGVASEHLSDVHVGQDGEASVVTLVGLEDPVYTAFLHSDPHTLVLDMGSVDIGSTDTLIPVYDGLVEHVSLSPFAVDDAEPLTRVEIALTESAEYEVNPSSEGLVVRMWMAEPMAEAWDSMEDAAEAAADPWSDAEAEVVAASDPMTEVDPPPAATQLMKIGVNHTPGGAMVHLEANGMIASAESFTLENPARLVLDLPGMTSQGAPDRMEMESSWISRIRVGSHPDKVRVVIDAGDQDLVFEGRRVMPAANGMFVTLGTGEEIDQLLADGVSTANEAWDAEARASMASADETEAVSPVEMAEADDELMDVEGMDDSMPASPGETSAWAEAEAGVEMMEDEDGAESGDVVSMVETTDSMDDAEPMAASGVEIFGLQYDSQPERERVTVLGADVMEYEIHTPDPNTVVVSILGGVIAPAAEGRLATRSDGPISLVRAFQQPDVMQPETRVVVTRAANLEPQVTRRGSLLFIDFENTGEVAPPAPAFAEPMATMPASEAMAAMPAEMPESEVEEGLATEGVEMAAEMVEPESTMVAETLPASEPVLLDTEMAAIPAPMAAEALTDEGSWLPANTAPAAMPPASLEPPAAVELLKEGGLIDGKDYQGRRISLDFKDVPVADVLRLIAEVSDLNLIAGEEVAGKVTIRLVDVPWDQALDVILLTKGLGFVRVGNVLRIAPDDILKAEEEVRLQERRNKEKLEDLMVKLQPVNYADVTDMEKLVKRLLSPRGTVNTDKRTNTLILKDIPSVIDEATALVKAVDTQTPQVLIEAKIVEASLDFARELGSEWSLSSQPLDDGFDDSSALTRTLGGEDFNFHGANNVQFSNVISAARTGALNLGAFLLDERLDLDVQIQAHESTGDGKVISSPRVVTLDNEGAEIQQGVSIPFQTFENGDAKLEFIDAVLSLKVTPQITSDHSVLMQIEVTRNAPDDSVPTPTGSPAIAKNQAKTKTLVKDGQTLVLGGIYTITKTENESRTPYLHRIPILGAAFKSKRLKDNRKELLIFVTPHILTGEDAG